jgi:hypothetical protein
MEPPEPDVFLGVQCSGLAQPDARDLIRNRNFDVACWMLGALFAKMKI